jgi:hypothetical protein
MYIFCKHIIYCFIFYCYFILISWLIYHIYIYIYMYLIVPYYYTGNFQLIRFYNQCNYYESSCKIDHKTNLLVILI